MKLALMSAVATIAIGYLVANTYAKVQHRKHLQWVRGYNRILKCMREKANRDSVIEFVTRVKI